MKTLLKILFSLCSGCIIFVGCHSLDYSIPESRFGDNPYSVSLNEAIGIADMFFSDNSTAATKSSEIQLKNTFSICNDNNSPYLHVINYADGGYAVIAGDNRIMPVQAYSPTGYFADNIESFPLGLKIWLESVQNAIADAENSPSTKVEVALAWAKYMKTSVKGLATRSLTPESGFPPEADTIAGPFLTDSWHQNSPYNDYLTRQTFYDINGYPVEYTPVVGCVPLAIARIMRYNTFPSSYAWSSMPNSTPQTTQTRNFIKDVHYRVKTYADNNNYSFVYLVSSSGLSPYTFSTGVGSDFPIGEFLRTQYGYASAVDESYSYSSSYQKMRRELIDYHLPCILSGKPSTSNKVYGHAWVCDGYRYTCIHDVNSTGETVGAFVNTYLHFCWGQTSTTIDGWFYYNVINMDGISYKYNMRLTHRISPTINYWENL